MRHRTTAFGLALAALLAGAAGAGAHAFLERADPRVGSTVRASPAEVRLWFTERLESAFSSGRVLDESGRPVQKADSRVDPGNPALLLIPVPALAPGRYKVVWRVLSIDTHVSEGDFTFRIAP